jgi:uncharacterized protein (TIGR03067 family)
VKVRSLLVLAVVFLAGADKKEDPVRNEVKQLQGTWKMVALEINGERVAADRFQGTLLVIKGNTYTTKIKGKSYAATFTLNPAKKPRHIDMTFADGPNKGKVARGVYELTKDTFKLCRAQAPEKKRPGKLATHAYSGLFLVVWKRVKR